MSRRSHIKRAKVLACRNAGWSNGSGATMLVRVLAMVRRDFGVRIHSNLANAIRGGYPK
jgi:hypothetical protein